MNYQYEKVINFAIYFEQLSRLVEKMKDYVFYKDKASTAN